MIRSGLRESDILATDQLLDLLVEDSSLPSERKADLVRVRILDGIDHLDRPDHRRALRALARHPYDEDRADAPELEGIVLKRGPVLKFAGRVLDHRDPTAPEPGYSKRWAETTESNILVPRLLAKLQEQEGHTPSLVGAAAEPWRDMSIAITVSQLDDSLVFSEEWQFQTDELLYAIALCRGIGRSARVLSDCPSIHDVWIGRPSLTEDQCRQMLNKRYSVGVRRNGSTRVEWLTLREFGPPITAELLAPLEEADRETLIVVGTHYPGDTDSVVVRRQMRCLEGSHHYYWLTDRSLVLREIVLDFSALPTEILDNLRVLPFLPRYTSDVDASSDLSVLARQRLLLDEPRLLPGHGFALIW